MKEFLLSLLVAIVFIFLISTCTSYYSMQKLTSDGFKVIQEYNTYVLVEKNNHTYIATPTGMYGLEWSYEHSPECKCMWIKNKINKILE